MAAGPTTMPVLEADGTTIRTLLGVQDGSNQFSAGAMLVHPTTGAPLIGQATKANSLPVAFASNQVGTAGTPSADVITVQGISGGTAQPITPSLPTAALSTRTAINAASSGDNTLIAAVVGQTIRVHKLFFIASGTVNIKFKDGAGSDLTPAMPLYAGGGVTLDFDGDPWFVTTAGNAFVLYLSAAVQISGRIYYSQS